MNPFNFLGSVFNQMLINPRSSEQDKKDQYFLKKKFEEIYGDKNYFLIPSSGSSSVTNESAKLIALHQDAILNSAKRVNSFFNINSGTGISNFGCVLPTFHVGGLGTYARSFLAKGQVFERAWKPDEISEWLEKNQIHILSLVPTQVFDIVQRNISAPSCLEIVFIGGSRLSEDLKLKIENLGWPTIATYGMTESASMIAVAKNKMQLLPDVEGAIQNGKLKIKCDSLMTCSLQKINDNVKIQTLDHGWFQTDDIVELEVVGSETRLKFLGRDSDFIKINSEGVSLSQLRSLLADNQQLALLAISNERSENEIVAVYESSISLMEVKQLLSGYNERVRPFEKIKKLYCLSALPRTDLRKIKYPAISELIKGQNYETI